MLKLIIPVALLLSGCVSISGPCSISNGSAECQTGGKLDIVWPASIKKE